MGLHTITLSGELLRVPIFKTCSNPSHVFEKGLILCRANPGGASRKTRRANLFFLYLG